jgi:hypothetical protein
VLASIAMTACGGGDDGGAVNAQSSIAAAVTTVATTIPATTTTESSPWSRDTLVALEPCLSTLRLIVDQGTVDDGIVEDAFDQCEPASVQLKVDADLAATNDGALSDLYMSFLMLSITAYRVGEQSESEVVGTATKFLTQWETQAP